MMGKGCIKTDDHCDRVIFLALFLPVYAAEAGGEFGSVCFMMRNTGTTDAVTGTSFFCAGTIDIVMRTGHGWRYFLTIMCEFV